MKIQKLAQNASLNYIQKEFISLSKMMDVTWYGDSMVDTEFNIEKLINDIKKEIKKYNKEALPYLLELYKKFYARVFPRIRKILNKNTSIESLPNFIKSNIEKFNQNEANLMLDVFNIVPKNIWFGQVMENLNVTYEPKTKLLSEYEQILENNKHLFTKNAYKMALELSREKLNLTRDEIVILETIKDIWSKYANLIRSNLKDLYVLSESHGENSNNKTLQNQDKLRKEWIKRILGKISMLKFEINNYKKSQNSEQDFINVTEYTFEQAEIKLNGWLYDVVSYLPKDLKEKYLSQIKSYFNPYVKDVKTYIERRDAAELERQNRQIQQNKDVASLNFDDSDDDIQFLDDEEVEEVEEVEIEIEEEDEPKETWMQKAKNLIPWFKKSDEEINENFLKFAKNLK